MGRIEYLGQLCLLYYDSKTGAAGRGKADKTGEIEREHMMEVFVDNLRKFGLCPGDKWAATVGSKVGSRMVTMYCEIGPHISASHSVSTVSTL